MGERVIFGHDDVPGYRADAEAGATAGVVVVQEWWGVNPQIMGVADRLAAAGFCTLVPDLFRGRVTQDPDEARHLMGGLDWMGAIETDIAAAAEHLRGEQGCTAVAVLGFCMGGALSLLSAIYLPPRVQAAVSFYGIPPRDIGDPRRVEIPFQGHFGTEDQSFPPRAVAALEAGLRASGSPYELFSYEGAGHAFLNEQRPEVYREVAAATAWERTLTFLRRHLPTA